MRCWDTRMHSSKRRKKEKGDLNSLKDRRPRNHSKNNPENHLLDLQPSNNGLHHSKERTWHLHLKRVTFQKNQNYNFTKKNWWPLPKLNGITWLNNKLQHISKSYTSLIDVIQEYINTSEPRTQKNISISLQMTKSMTTEHHLDGQFRAEIVESLLEITEMYNRAK